MITSAKGVKIHNDARGCTSSSCSTISISISSRRRDARALVAIATLDGMSDRLTRIASHTVSAQQSLVAGGCGIVVCEIDDVSERQLLQVNIAQMIQARWRCGRCLGGGAAPET